MRLEGIHHITLITGDAPRNVDFYTRVLGLRLVKKTVNQDDPTVYHLFYADEAASAGADITFFEYPGARRGRAGAGMVHTIVYRVGSEEALEFWEERLRGEGRPVERRGERLAFDDPEGVRFELTLVETEDEPLVAEHPGISSEVALQGFDGVRAYSADAERSRELFEDTLGFESRADATWEIRGETRGGSFAFDPAPVERGEGGAGTVHHVAWASTLGEHEAWRERIAGAGMQPTPVIDRFYFKSIYFREPSGVLFEIATLGPGFATDEDPAHLGERLSLPPAFEHLRERIEPALTPLPASSWRAKIPKNSVQNEGPAGLVRSVVRGKDAGSAHIQRIWARLRTPPRAAERAGTAIAPHFESSSKGAATRPGSPHVLPLVLERPAAGEPAGSLVLLLGRGADEHDL